LNDGGQVKFLSRGRIEQRHRLIILTDMENEPDDSQTMVKLLLYSNEIDVEGLIAVTSRWLKHTVYPESIVDRVHAYGVVRDNLLRHAPGFPTPQSLLRRTAGGQRDYGMGGVGDGNNSPGSELIIRAVDRNDPRPIHLAINAGSNTLAQALWDVRRDRSPADVARFVAKIRVYDDSGQDDAGAWMCHTFPELFYVRSRSQVFGLFGPTEESGPQPWAPLSQYEWAEQHVRTRHGVLGALYPQRLWRHRDGSYGFAFMDGGGTTTWLGLANKGLYDPAEIAWGGWGGRFSRRKEQVSAGQHEVDEEEAPYKPWRMYPQAEDTSWLWRDGEEDSFTTFSGVRGKVKYHNRTFAPLWRWRDAYTRDFQGRMDWCVADYEHANHHPVAVFHGDENRTIVRLQVAGSEVVKLDASGSWDPDNRQKHRPDELDFIWFVYPEAGTYAGKVALEGIDESIATVPIPDDAAGKQIHVILEVTDRDPEVPLTSYRRIVMDVQP
jgi:hypothetical protein